MSQKVNRCILGKITLIVKTCYVCLMVASIEFVEQCIHLGTNIYSDISNKNIDNVTIVTYI